MIYLYLFGTCFHFIYVFMIIAKYIEPITYVLKYNTQTPTLLHHHKKYHPPMR